MSIEYYGDTPSIKIESVADLLEALDILHTQVMDNLQENPSLLRILEAAMEQVEAL